MESSQMFIKDQPDDLEQPSRTWMSRACLICGWMACALNVLVITSPVGVVLGILAVIFGMVAYLKKQDRFSMLIPGLLSFLIVLLYVISAAVIYLKDPTL